GNHGACVRCAPAVDHILDVAAGGKAFAGAGEDRDVDLVVMLDVGPDALDLTVNVHADGVQRFRSIDGDDGDAVVLFDLEAFVAVVGHGVCSLDFTGAAQVVGWTAIV